MAGPQHSVSAPVGFAHAFRPGSRSSNLNPNTHTATITANKPTTPKTTTRRFASLRGLHDRSTSSRLKKQQAQNPPPAPSSTAHDELGDMIDATGPKSRRERTLIGTECAACEEPLEHTLRGERILQLSCGHVAHEACFYEFIKEFESQECPSCNAPLGLDTSRGGNLDFGNTGPSTPTTLSVTDKRQQN